MIYNRSELNQVLLKQLTRYPHMQIQDMVKLLYQNEFAGGHFILSEEDSLQRLQQEMDALPEGNMATDLFEDIGNGLCRMHLASVRETTASLPTVNRFFCNTANTITGSVQSLIEKLQAFIRLGREGLLPYPLEEVEQYIHAYSEKGYPPVGHSEQYRNAYCPAYRIVKAAYHTYFSLFSRIDMLLEKQEFIYVAVDGNSGAGKSSLAALLEGIYNCNVFHMDDFFLPPALKTPQRLSEVGGNIDYDRFEKEVITGLRSKKPFQYYKYDCKKQQLDQRVSVMPKRLQVIEGCYSLHPRFIQQYHLKVFLSVGEKEQSRRILERSGEFLHQKFISEWIPKENQYFEKMQIQQRCDLTFST